MQRDVSRLEAALTAIRDNPQEWDQGHWARKGACGTTYCLAGQVVTQAGATIAWDNADPTYGTFCQVDGWPQTIRAYAAKLCRLSGNEASQLFNGHNTLPMLEAMVKDIANDGHLRDHENYLKEHHPQFTAAGWVLRPD